MRGRPLCRRRRVCPDPSEIFYIIGTEVLSPGGETEEPDTLDVTSVDRYRATIETHHDAFMTRGLTGVWSRIVSVVTQPWVDFGHTSIYPFVPEKAARFSAAILDDEGLTFEAHSAGYRSTRALSDLVKNHFFFLKVGPELTFRFRDSVWALASIQASLGGDRETGIRCVMRAQMTAQPEYWQEYYSESMEELEVLKIYCYSDCIRYY